ncbi:MAG TPA: SPASM domain-containing protein [Phycisphaerae bacterium]|nr:SPASM domain-containing protein [Phycisphaerae bacterium]
MTWDGKVALCFQDADAKKILGDLNTESIESIWTGRHLAKRREHVRGIFRGLCENCSSETEVQLPRSDSRLYPPTLRCSP